MNNVETYNNTKMIEDLGFLSLTITDLPVITNDQISPIYIYIQGVRTLYNNRQYYRMLKFTDNRMDRCDGCSLVRPVGFAQAGQMPQSSPLWQGEDDNALFSHHWFARWLLSKLASILSNKIPT